jgi:hypothetical protein
MISNQDTGTTATVTPSVTPGTVLTNLYDIASAIRDLKWAGFTILPSTTDAAFVAMLERNDFRVRVTLCLLRAHQVVALSRVAPDGKRQYLLLRTGQFRRGEWLPFDMDDAVQAALQMARQIGTKAVAGTGAQR